MDSTIEPIVPIGTVYCLLLLKIYILLYFISRFNSFITIAKFITNIFDTTPHADCNIQSLKSLIDNTQIWLIPCLLQWRPIVLLWMAQFLHDFRIGLLQSYIFAIFHIFPPDCLYMNFESFHPLIGLSLALFLALWWHPTSILTQPPC